MKVTSLKYQKKNPNRVSIYVDDKYRFSLHVDFLMKYEIYQGIDITNEVIERASLDDIRNRIFDRSVAYLARGPRSEFQMRRYVQKVLFDKKGDWYDKDDKIDIDVLADETIAKLAKVNLIDDEKYANAYASSVIRSKAVSKFYLRGLMTQKGLDKKLIDEVVNELVVDELDSAKKALYKKYKSDIIEKGDQKKIQFLQRKGFSWDIISQLINNDV